MKRMHFEQFYVQPQDISSNRFILKNEEARHAVKVMRKNIGDYISAADGNGRVVSGCITHLQNDKVTVSLEQSKFNIGEPGIFLTLAQGVPKGSHFDWVVEKGTEIGVSAFQPILTERCIIDPAGRLERWRSKAFAAMKQSGRSRCPEILAPCSLEQFLNSRQDEQVFIAHESETARISNEQQYTLDRKACALMIGPEGGFTEKEYTISTDKGAIPISLGPRRLRSETAALVGIVQILSLHNEI